MRTFSLTDPSHCTTNFLRCFENHRGYPVHLTVRFLWLHTPVSNAINTFKYDARIIPAMESQQLLLRLLIPRSVLQHVFGPHMKKKPRSFKVLGLDPEVCPYRVASGTPSSGRKRREPGCEQHYRLTILHSCEIQSQKLSVCEQALFSFSQLLCPSKHSRSARSTSIFWEFSPCLPIPDLKWPPSTFRAFLCGWPSCTNRDQVISCSHYTNSTESNEGAWELALLGAALGACCSPSTLSPSAPHLRQRNASNNLPLVKWIRGKDVFYVNFSKSLQN